MPAAVSISGQAGKIFHPFPLTFMRRRRLHANLNANLKLDFYRWPGADADANVSI